jgi:hypothetical protein
MLFHIFSEFLEEVSEDVLPNERTGYQESAIWQKLYIPWMAASLAFGKRLA